ncbi:YbjN domain-containing protein [Deinococcus taeanensis]|uniref:YbjN domain-containing protein n=1 Tax=Deinococcus taeanensis TaxID=2737050 RepID=UPI001CDD3ED4|nr:YbjN domain-containing protein [Deinococcus taeanensis]UBV42184.1 YbjN domain-containing protein [Deinococcus taeanensis]
MTRRLLAASLTLSLTAPALAGGAAAPAGAQVQPATPAALLSALKEAGYRVTMNPTEADGEPSMTIVSGEHKISVWLSGCKNNVCSRVTASTSWDYSDQDDALDTEVVNDWNGNYYTQAYIYEGAYYLDSTMPVRGGYTKATLKAWMTDYLEDVKSFEGELPES